MTSVELNANERLGIALRILSTLSFAIMGACIKALGDAVPLGQIVFFRSAVALLPLIGFLWWCGEWPHGLSTRRPFGHAVRCSLGAAAMFTSFATIQLLPLAEVTMLSYLAPVILAVLGWAMLQERFDARRALGVALGLSGGIAFTVPALTGGLPNGGSIGVLLGITTAVLTAFALVQVRKLTLAGEHAGAIAFWFAIVSALGGLATLPLGWAVPDMTTALFLIGTGLTGGLAHIFMTLSFRHAGATALAPFEYLSILWAAALGAMLFAEVPGLAFFLAAPLILAGAYCAKPARIR